MGPKDINPKDPNDFKVPRVPRVPRVARIARVPTWISRVPRWVPRVPRAPKSLAAARQRPRLSSPVILAAVVEGGELCR